MGRASLRSTRLVHVFTNTMTYEKAARPFLTQRQDKRDRRILNNLIVIANIDVTISRLSCPKKYVTEHMKRSTSRSPRGLALRAVLLEWFRSIRLATRTPDIRRSSCRR